MNSVLLLRLWTYGAALLLPLSVSHLSAQEENRVLRKEGNRVVIRAPGKFWLGLVNRPASATLQSQLGIEDRLVIEHVLPESPAAKAQLAEHDILLRFGDTEIHELDDLLDALEERGEQPTDLVILRKGEEQTVRVTPTKPPVGDFSFELPGHAAEVDSEILKRWLGQRPGPSNRPHTLRFRVLGPGFVESTEEEQSNASEEGTAQDPENTAKDLDVTIHKSGDQPAEITVQRAGRTWTVREDHLKELPADVRSHVQRLLTPRALTLPRQRIQIREFRQHPPAPQRPVGPNAPASPFTPQHPRPNPAEEIVREVQRLHRQIESQSGNALQELRADVQELREELQQLRQELQKDAADEKSDR